MNLPLVIDIAIGLIFMYLIFSLLTSEILEIITTLLQWRAVHLKESIEGLLAGNESEKFKQARILANRLYQNPVINTLNQEAKGLGASLPRRINQSMGKSLREIFKRENVFGNKNTGPSYIPSESFATSLLDTLGIPLVIQKFTLLRMQNFKTRLITQVEAELLDAEIPGIDDITLKKSVANKEDETTLQEFLKERGIDEPSQVLPILRKFYNFKQQLDDAIKAHQMGALDLVTTVDRFEEISSRYIEELQASLNPKTERQTQFIKELKSLHRIVFGTIKNIRFENTSFINISNEKKVLIRSLQPNLTETVEIVKGFWQLKRYWSIYKAVRRGAAIEAVKKLENTVNTQLELSQVTKKELLDNFEELKTSISTYGYEKIRKTIENYPKLNLARKARIKQTILDKVNSIIESSYQEIRQVLEGSQGAELPESVRNTLLEKLAQEKSGAYRNGLLSYEFEKIRIGFEKHLDKTDKTNNTNPIAQPNQANRIELSNRVDGIKSPDVTTLNLLGNLDEIIEVVDQIVDNSYDKIAEEIKKETKLLNSDILELIHQINDINGSSFDFDYESIKKVISNSKVGFSVKQRFLHEVDETINDALKNEYEQFKKAVGKQSDLTWSVKQSLLLLAAAVTLRKDHELAKLIDQLLGISSLPEPIERNLLLLAQQAQIKVDGVKEELNQFRREIEVWFDRSMERATGVYKRNNKLVAIIIGSFVAVAVNADTVHMVKRLSEDQFLRSTVLGAARQIAIEDSAATARCLSKTEAERIADPQCSQQVKDINKAAESLSLPIGWGTDNRNKQWEEAQRLGNLMFLRYLLGWLVSGIALSMGASFWYELLGKVINVRNTGQPPSSRKETSSSGEANASK